MSTRTRAVSNDDLFTTDTAGLAQASAPQVVHFGGAGRFDLRIAPVANRIGASRSRLALVVLASQ